MGVIGLDVGTSGCKSILLSGDGSIVGRAHREYRCTTPQAGWLELDPHEVWRMVRECIIEVVQLAAPGTVEAICIATMGDSFTTVDSQGKVIYPFILASDNRSQKETRTLERMIGRERLFSITGMPANPINTITKILWMRDNLSSIYEKAGKFLCCEEFIVAILTGKAVSSWASACRTLAFDVRGHCWSEEILEKSGIPVRLFPEVAPPGSIVGEVSADLCQTLFLSPCVKVVAGGMDQTCGLVGSDALLPGVVQNSMGTVEAISATIDIGSVTPELEKKLLESDFSLNVHILPEKVLVMGLVLNSGSILNWFRTTMLDDDRQRFLACFEGISHRPVPLVFHPYFSGKGTPGMDASTVGCWWGMDFNTSIQDLFQSMIQGLSMEMVGNIERFQELGIAIDSVSCVGGGSRSLEWLQMKADMLGLPVYQSTVQDAPAYGAAILAGSGIGKWTLHNLRTGTQDRDSIRLLPRAGTKADFHELREVTVRLYESQRSFIPQLKKMFMDR